MTRFGNIFLYILPALALGAGGCFTGVESTPRIKEADVKRQQAAGVTSEQLFLSDLTPLPPAQWLPGRGLLVANDRISLIFNSASDHPEGLSGHTIYFDSFTPARSLTGDDAGELIFRADDGRRLHYRVPGLTREKLDTISVLAVPFTVDLDLVRRIDEVMRGRRLFVRTPAWYSSSTRQPINGLRHIEVQIDSVGAGDDNFLAAVYFSIVDADINSQLHSVKGNYMLFMSIGTNRAATRNFDTLFSFDNPRKSYPEIKDDVWELIIRSRVRAGMTRDECRLALGAPPSLERVPTDGGMRERWTYSDGVFLIFDDGYLTRFRL